MSRMHGQVEAILRDLMDPTRRSLGIVHLAQILVNQEARIDRLECKLRELEEKA